MNLQSGKYFHSVYNFNLDFKYMFHTEIINHLESKLILKCTRLNQIVKLWTLGNYIMDASPSAVTHVTPARGCWL